MLTPPKIDAEHIQRVELRAEHKKGEHRFYFVDECPECQADHDLVREAAIHAPNPKGRPSND